MEWDREGTGLRYLATAWAVCREIQILTNIIGIMGRGSAVANRLPGWGQTSIGSKKRGKGSGKKKNNNEAGKRLTHD